MEWALFFQIEVIMLTAGLIILFVISTNQALKDNSFFKRIQALAQAISDYQKNSNEQKANEKAKMFEKFLDNMSKKGDQHDK